MANRHDDGLKIAKKTGRAQLPAALVSMPGTRGSSWQMRAEGEEKKRGCGWASEWQKEDMLITCSCCEESGDKLVV